MVPSTCIFVKFLNVSSFTISIIMSRVGYWDIELLYQFLIFYVYFLNRLKERKKRIICIIKRNHQKTTTTKASILIKTM